MQRVVANQFVNPSAFSTEITELVKLSSPSDPDHGFEDVAGAAYFGPNTSKYNAQTTVQQIELDSMAALATLQTQTQSLMSTVTTWVTKLKQNIPVIMYERAGLNLSTSSTNVPWWNAYVAAQTDSGMYSVLMTYFDDLQDDGVAGFNYSAFVLPVSQYGEWGTVDYIGEPSSMTPKYNALLDFIDSQGPSLYLSDSATTLTAGTTNNFTVTAYDAYGNVDTGYTGKVQFSSSDPNASLPASYTFTAADAGEHTFPLVLDSVGPQAISVTDVTNGLYAFQWGISVQPAAAASLAVVGYPSPSTAGVQQEMIMFALDAYGNIASGYTGTVKFSTSDPYKGGLPANQTFTSGDQGAHSFSLYLGTVGVQSITATDTSSSSIAGTESGITILPAAAYSLTVTGFPNPTTAGVAHNFTVTAYDPFWQRCHRLRRHGQVHQQRSQCDAAGKLYLHGRQCRENDLSCHLGNGRQAKPQGDRHNDVDHLRRRVGHHGPGRDGQVAGSHRISNHRHSGNSLQLHCHSP